LEIKKYWDFRGRYLSFNPFKKTRKFKVISMISPSIQMHLKSIFRKSYKKYSRIEN
jgi:hypothetical protein